MTPELKDLVRTLQREMPTAYGRPVEPKLYAEASIHLNDEGYVQLASEDVMLATGKSNTLFCGHFIYPEVN